MKKLLTHTMFAFVKRKQTLTRKLFVYIFLLALLLLLLFLIGMFLIGGYSGTKQRVANTLEFQSEVFSRQITSHYSNLAVMGIQLSEQTTIGIERYLAENGIAFDELNVSQTHITGIQEALIEPLHQKLLETDCTGAFILLNAQVNANVDNAESSRSGLYLQRNSLDSIDTRILLYRGLAEVGKRHDAMPHRKWRLEFDTSLFPEYKAMTTDAALPLTESYRLSEVITLPGTSERIMLLTLPIRGEDGRLYGLCGFEVNESYFKHIFAQPSELNQAVFCLTKGANGLTNAESSLSAGIANDYYLAPSGSFRSTAFGSGLFTCESENDAYIGVVNPIRLCPGTDSFSISTLIPRQDYDALAFRDSLRIALLLLVFVAFSAVLCFYCTKRYLHPLMQSLERIRAKEYANAESQVTEIDDLFAFLAEQDRQSEAALAAVQQEKFSVEAELAQIQTEREQLRNEKEQMQTEHEQDKQELQRLAYSRKNEVDPADYEVFRQGIQNLTATERRVFNYYLEGKSVKEITELMGVKESTVRFHNRNLYMTLGVNSLKQLLRYAAILKQEQEAAQTNETT